MDLKRLFRRAAAPRESTARLTEGDLRARLGAHPGDLASRLELARRLAGRGEATAACAELLAAARGRADDDLPGAALRLLAEAERITPGQAEVAELRARLDGLAPTLDRRNRLLAGLATRRPETVDPASLTPPELRRFWIDLATTPLVTELDDVALGLLLNSAEVQQWSARSVVVRGGQSLARCYVIAEGAIDALEEAADGSQRVLHRFLPGDVVGERALLDDEPWPARLRTTDGVAAALRLTRQVLAERVTGRPGAEALVAGLRRHGRDRELRASIGV